MIRRQHKHISTRQAGHLLGTVDGRSNVNPVLQRVVIDEPLDFLWSTRVQRLAPELDLPRGSGNEMGELPGSFHHIERTLVTADVPEQQQPDDVIAIIGPRSRQIPIGLQVDRIEVLTALAPRLMPALPAIALRGKDEPTVCSTGRCATSNTARGASTTLQLF